jgi:hypothetical protein
MDSLHPRMNPLQPLFDEGVYAGLIQFFLSDARME